MGQVVVLPIINEVQGCFQEKNLYAKTNVPGQGKKRSGPRNAKSTHAVAADARIPAALQSPFNDCFFRPADQFCD